jgi:hypothetical protein
MDEILANSKALEYIQNSHDPLYEKCVEATEIVKKFIRDRGLILYGGTAIDYALRLKGTCIYPDTMLAVPDLDFFSPNHVFDSYDLADLLYTAGYKEARAISAYHVETQRVDLESNHWMADISYKPKEIFDKLPVIEYEGMKVIHPDFQRLDFHSSLCFPYDNPPMEVIFNRWSKDIKRFNLVDQYYPIEKPDKVNVKKIETQIPLSVTHKCLLSGAAAYAAICRVLKESNLTLPSDVLDLSFDIKSNVIQFDNIIDEVVLLSHNLESSAKYLKLSNIKSYHPYTNVIPERTTGIADKIQYDIYSCGNRLVTYQSVTLSGNKFRIVSCSYLLMHLLSQWLVHNSLVHKLMYVGLLNMIHNIKHDILGLPTDVFGSNNSSLSKQLAIQMLDHELKDAPAVIKATNYRAGNQKPHPEFDITQMVYYNETGKEKIIRE